MIPVPANTPFAKDTIVSYDCGRERRTKRFDNPIAAKRFYISKFNKGKHPQIRLVEKEDK